MRKAGYVEDRGARTPFNDQLVLEIDCLEHCFQIMVPVVSGTKHLEV
jgi:hypothetical protein